VQKPKLDFGLGFTAKIRDAKIALASGDLSGEKVNVGFVPIINFGSFGVRLRNSESFSKVMRWPHHRQGGGCTGCCNLQVFRPAWSKGRLSYSGRRR